MRNFFFCLSYWAFLMAVDPRDPLGNARRQFWEKLAPTRLKTAPWRFCSLYRHPKLGVIDLDAIPF